MFHFHFSIVSIFTWLEIKNIKMVHFTWRLYLNTVFQSYLAKKKTLSEISEICHKHFFIFNFQIKNTLNFSINFRMKKILSMCIYSTIHQKKKNLLFILVILKTQTLRTQSRTGNRNKRKKEVNTDKRKILWKQILLILSFS